MGLGIFYPAMLAPQAAWYAELFDTEFRMSGFAFSREIGSVLAAGVAPFVATALYAWAGHWWPILCYMGVLAVLTVVALAMGPETVRRGTDRRRACAPALSTGTSAHRHPRARTALDRRR